MKKGGSILLRPNRAPSRRNETSMDTQYERDQRRLEARRAAVQERNAGILGRLQKDPEQKERERAAAAEEMRAHMVRAKATAAERDMAEQRETAQAARRITKEAEGDDAKQRERREWSHSMMMQNRELCEYRYEQRQRMAQDEKDVEREQLAHGFMNRFGTSLQ
jgi:hypothetical protein